MQLSVILIQVMVIAAIDGTFYAWVFGLISEIRELELYIIKYVKY
jgi:hypothetical protein